MKFLIKLAPVLFLTGLILIFFWPVLFSGSTFISGGMLYSDLMSLNYPLKDWYRELLINNQLPFWTSLVGNGYPVFAEGQIGALYPPHLLLFRFLPTLLAFNLNLFLHFLLAALGTFVFCRISLKLSSLASILAGLAYSFSGFFFTHLHQVNIILVVSYLPLVFLAIERIVKSQKFLWAFILALTLAFQILAGYVQLVFYTSLAGLLFFVLLEFIPQAASEQKRSFKKALLLIVLAFILGFGLASVQLLSTWELTNFSVRAEGLSLEAAAEWDWPLWALSLFINPLAYDIYLPTPDFHPIKDALNLNVLYGYIGIIPILLVIWAIIARIRKRFVMIFLILLFGAFLFGMGRSTQLFTIFWEVIPGMKFFRQPVKILFLIEFCLAILAAFGWDYFKEFLAKKKPHWQNILPKFGLILILLTFMDLYFLNGVRLQPTLSGREWFSAPPIVDFFKSQTDNLHFRYYTESTRNLDYALFRDNKIQKELQNSFDPDFNVLYRIPSTQDWLTLFLKNQEKLNENTMFLDGGTGSLRLQNKKALDLQSVKFIISHLPIEDKELVLRQEFPLSRPIKHFGFFQTSQGLKTVTNTTSATYVYENQTVYPRVLFVNEARIIKNEENTLETILGKDFDPEKEVILEENRSNTDKSQIDTLLRPFDSAQGFGGQADNTDSKVMIKEDKESEVKIEVETEKPGFLVLSDTYYPGWRAYLETQIDTDKSQIRTDNTDKELKIYRADFAFRAVEVPAGKHTVKFSFEPTYWKLGLWISGGTLLVVLLGLGWSLWKRI